MERRALLGLKSNVTLAGGGGGSRPAGGFTRLPTLTANFRRSDGRRGVLTVEAGVDVQDAALATRTALLIPRLRAAYAAVVQRVAAEMAPGAPPNVERLVALLQAATDQTVGRRGARLLIGTVMAV